ncbi:MAG: NnrS family protein [Amphritea sp.]
MIVSSGIRSLVSRPVFVAAFRPFYLLGSLFGVSILLLSSGYLSGQIILESQRLSFGLWHGHELIHGFAGAIVLGFILTALPSWAGARELRGGKLILLVMLWLAGRLAFWLEAWLPLELIAVADSSVFIVASLLIFEDLRKAKKRFFLVVLPIFAGFYLGNILFYVALQGMDYSLASLALKISLFAIIFKFATVGGYLSVVFSNNVLAARGLPLIEFSKLMDICALSSIVLMFTALIIPFSPVVTLLCSLFAFVSHLLRLASMRFWQIAHEPLLLAMNLAYGWMVVSFLLKAFYEAGWLAEDIWLHAFTIGAMGTIMLSLMTRVTLRHTGRPLRLSGAGKVILGLAAISASFRVFSEIEEMLLLLGAGVIFSLALLLYLGIYGRMLLLPCQPKDRPSGG